MNLLIACADIGSVSKNRFGWWASDKKSGSTPEDLVTHIAEALNNGIPVALGFECPLTLPLSESATNLTCARPGEGNRAWSAGAGCGALTTGLVQTAWVLRAIRNKVNQKTPAFLEWDDFNRHESGLFIWEAFVSGKSKAAQMNGMHVHIADAKAAVAAFEQALPSPKEINAIQMNTDVYSIIGAALLRTGWTQDITTLSKSCLVVKP